MLDRRLTMNTIQKAILSISLILALITGIAGARNLFCDLHGCQLEWIDGKLICTVCQEDKEKYAPLEKGNALKREIHI